MWMRLLLLRLLMLLHIASLLVVLLAMPSANARDRDAARKAYGKAAEYHAWLKDLPDSRRSRDRFNRAIYLYRTVVDHDPTYGACDDALFAGMSAEGRVGDVKLYNDRVQFIVQGLREGDFYVPQAGTVVDVDIVRPDGVPGRDVVGELAGAVRAEGLRFGTYYSGGLDWTFDGTPLRGLIDLVARMPGGPDVIAKGAATTTQLTDAIIANLG